MISAILIDCQSHRWKLMRPCYKNASGWTPNITTWRLQLMQVRNREVVHGQKQSWSTLPSSWQTKKTTLVTNWTHALTKTAKKTVFEEIKKVLEERMSIEEFKEENISSFILYWQLKNSSSAFLLQENNFTSSSRAAILKLTAKKTLIIRLLLLVMLFVPSLHQTNNLRDALSDWTGNASSSIKTATVFTVFLLTLRKPTTESIQSAPS